jgi:Sulfatase
MTTTQDRAVLTAPAPSPRRRVLGRVVTVLAALLVFVLLAAPRELGQYSAAAFIRIPVEALAGVALLLVLPARRRRIAAVLGGVGLGLLAVLKIVNTGFLEFLARPFDPVYDWDRIGNAADVLGGAGAIGAAVLAVAVVALVAWAVVRLSRAVHRHRTGSTRAVAVLSVAWLVFAALGTQVVFPVPVAARSAAALAYELAQQVPASIAEQRAFEAQMAAPDPFRDAPAQDLLAGLRGKDVVLTFVESYGRSAVEDPAMAPKVDAVLDAGTRTLSAAGYSARSGYLTSPVFGGGSWLAHATLSSGLWVTNQRHHDALVATDRLTLNSAFQKAGWRTAAVMPGTFSDWPEQGFFGVDQVYDSRTMGNRAQLYNRFQTPDQYTLAAFQRAERATPGHAPVMAEIPLVTSHWPWANVPRLVGWDAVGDGTVYDAMGGTADPVGATASSPALMRAGYVDSIAYSLSSLISYVERYGDDNLVLVFLGDHQPAPSVTGQGASHDVPITIVARDPKVLDRIASWGWTDGLRPGPQAPVWRMDAFRDRFLTAFAR